MVETKMQATTQGTKAAELGLPEVKSVSDALQSIQIALEGYDDIFSDFDPSSYETRVLSDDFLVELKKRHAETKTGDLAVTFSIPEAARSEKTETLIKKRIKDYFRARVAVASKAIGDNQKKGLIRTVAGILVFFPVVAFPEIRSVPVDSILSVISWYLLWSGFDDLFEVPFKLKEESSFCEKFMKARYHFVSEESLLRSISSVADVK